MSDEAIRVKTTLEYKEGKVHLIETVAEESQTDKVSNEIFEALKKRNLSISEAKDVLDKVRLKIEDCRFI